MPALLLPDELFLLAHRRSGARRVDRIPMGAGLAGGTLGELRIRGRIGIDDTADPWMLAVHRDDPTGEPILDRALAVLAAEPPRPPHEWIERLRVTALDESADRLARQGLFNPEGKRRERVSNAIPAARARVVDAVSMSNMDSQAGMLALMVWAMELTGPVLGRLAWPVRYRLWRLAMGDWLCFAVRTTIGLYTQVPFQGGGG